MTTNETPELNRAERREGERFSRWLASPTRRRRFLKRVRSNPTITRAALVTLEELLEYSDDTAKKVWPSQLRVAKLTHVHVRTVQRHVKELKDAGYLLIFGSRAVRDPATGRWHRKKTNRYYFCTPKSQAVGNRKMRNACSDLHDTGAPLNDTYQETRRPFGPGGGLPLVEKYELTKARSRAVFVSDHHGCERCNKTRWIERQDGSVERCQCM